MQKAFLLFVVFSISFCLKSVGQSNTINITFDDNSYKKYVFIDSSSSLQCNSSGLSLQIGNDTSTSLNYSVFNNNYTNAKTYLRYAASDLQAALGTGAKILNGIQFKIKNKQSFYPYSFLNLTVGSIPSSTPNLVAGNNSFPVTPTTIVYLSNFTTTPGWNTINFSSGYYWDGVSDLVFNICYGSNFLSNIDQMEFTPMANNMALYGSNATTSPVGCSITTGTSSNLLPNIKFNYCTPPPYSGWQVCKTNKTGFGSGTTSKVIVTDSIKPYPKNDTSRFILKFDSLMYLNGNLVQGVIARMYFNFVFRMNTDSSKDFCQLDFSSDNGQNWFLAKRYSCYSYYSYNNLCCNDDSGLISGKIANWNYASFYLNPCGCPVRLTSGNYPNINFIQNSIWFRFSLITDSTFDNLPGCEIDSISFQRIWWQYCPSGIENISSKIPITISPNPSSSNFNLTTNETIAAKGFAISVTNLLGENIFSKNEIHQASYKIDAQQFPAGIYFVKTHCNGFADANEKIVVER